MIMIYVNCGGYIWKLVSFKLFVEQKGFTLSEINNLFMVIRPS